MTRMPGALWLPISRNYTNRRRTETRAVILHVDAGGARSLRGWFNNPAARASSHLHVRYDGTIEQYVDLDLIAWTSGDGNPTTIGVETQGTGRGKWTPAQLASLAKILAFVHEHYGVPLVAMKDSKRSSRGVGWHRLGVPANRAQANRRVSMTGGERWSSSPGKTCPGPDRIPQIPSIIERARALTNEEDADLASPETIQKIAEAAARATWSYRNPKLSGMDAYAILRQTLARANALPSLQAIRNAQSMHAGKIHEAVSRDTAAIVESLGSINAEDLAIGLAGPLTAALREEMGDVNGAVVEAAVRRVFADLAEAPEDEGGGE